MLVIDSADAVAEGMVDALRYLVDAAQHGDVKVIAVAAADSRQVVCDTITDRAGVRVTECAVAPLTDAQIEEVVAAVGELSRLAANPRSRELLRRLVVVDLLVRGRVSGVPLNDADAMREVWAALVRRHEVSDRGTPDAREFALLKLAELALDGGDALEVVAAIDATALDGLRHDGFLRTPVDDPYTIGPEFAHDEVRRYAVARLLLAARDPASRIAHAGTPRWALAAARLAAQAWLALPNSSTTPLRGRFATLQAALDALVDAGHGGRWGGRPRGSTACSTMPHSSCAHPRPSRSVGRTGRRGRHRCLPDHSRDHRTTPGVHRRWTRVDLVSRDRCPTIPMCQRIAGARARLRSTDRDRHSASDHHRDDTRWL